MKGLIRNNFYSVGSALKWTIISCIIVNFIVLIGSDKISSNDIFMTMLIIGQIGAFTGLTGTALEKDNASKWSKYEKTLPVKIRDITTARYISFLIFSVIGIFLATLTIALLYFISNNPLNFERIGYGYSFGIVFSLLVPAFLYPLVLKFGSDKVNIMLIISILITLFLFNFGCVVLTPYLINTSNSNTIYRLTSIVVSFMIFISSYFISISIYKKKEF